MFCLHINLPKVCTTFNEMSITSSSHRTKGTPTRPRSEQVLNESGETQIPAGHTNKPTQSDETREPFTQQGPTHN